MVLLEIWSSPYNLNAAGDHNYSIWKSEILNEWEEHYEWSLNSKLVYTYHINFQRSQNLAILSGHLNGDFLPSCWLSSITKPVIPNLPTVFDIVRLCLQMFISKFTWNVHLIRFENVRIYSSMITPTVSWCSIKWSF